MKRILLAAAAALLLLAGCAANPDPSIADEGGMTKLPWLQIDQETARQMMEADDGHVIVDVRRQDEYDAGHIPGAILIPNESIGTDRPEELPDLYQIILIYCRSGNRSKQAAQKLADMGYANIYEFGGIIDWTGDIVTTEHETE
ncbi:MAG: rhodanese-like domain-containing protein [Oscillospiraceae bacterium]|nr:rhodanese-like domain-containing protein [Oscillospiraceae bacterium]